jgi:chromosome segregation ATPase
MKARIASLEASLSDTSVRRSPAPSQHLFLPSIPGAAGEFDQSMVSEIASLQEQLFAAKTERDTYFRMSGEFERELLASSAALKELQASIIAANAQIGQQAQQLSDQVKTSSAAAAEAAAAAAASQAQLQAEVDAANGRAAVAAAAAVSAKEDLEVQIARANNLLQAEAAARASAAAERSRLEAMTQDHAAGISRAQALQKTLSDREEALFRITSELDREKEAAASSLAAASSASKELLDKVRGLETRLSDAQQQNSLLESQLQRLERSLSDHGTPETEAPESEREQRALRAYIERERDRLKLQSEASEASCRRLKFQLDAKEREAAELQAEVELSRQKLSGPCYSQVDLDRIGNMQKQVSLLTESNEHLRSQESSAQKLVLQWEERYNGVQGEMMQLRQAASLHIQVCSTAFFTHYTSCCCSSCPVFIAAPFFALHFFLRRVFLTHFYHQLLASAECQRDEYAKSLSELRDQYQRISSKNQDVDPLVHEELKSKHQELEKQYAEAAEKCIRMNTKLNEKKEAQLKHQIAFTDIQQKLQLSQTALTDAQQRHRQQHQELQLQHQQQQEELKQQHHQQQERDRLATSQLEKTVDELKKEIAALRASVPAVGQQHQELQHQHQQQQERDRLAISQLEKTVEELKKELAALRASVPVVGIADVAIPDGSQHKSKPSNVAAAAPPTVAAVGRSVILNPAAAAFGQAGTFQFQPASSVPAATAIADSAVEAESLGEKRSGDTTPAGAKQTKRVLCFVCHVFAAACNSYFPSPRFLS